MKTMFQKRHYESIANTMQEAHPGMALSADNRAVIQWDATVRALADSFKADNYNFDRERFLHACKPGQNVRARTAHLKAA